jgi:IS30 family transposase
VHSKTELERVARELNQWPRKQLQFLTPIEEMEGLLLQ